MSVTKAEFLEANAAHRQQRTGPPLEAVPSRRVAIVTCMDARIDVYRALGLEVGQAHVIRNAGGVVTDDVIRSLCLSQQELGTNEVAVIHHTRCGLEGLDEDAFIEQLQTSTGAQPPWAIRSFDNAADDVRASIAALMDSPFLAFDDAISGYLYDVDSDTLSVVD